MDDRQYSEYLIEQDAIIDVRGAISHSIVGGPVEAYTLFLRTEILLPSDDCAYGPYIKTDTITVPSRFVNDENAIGPNLKSAISRFLSAGKCIGYFISQRNDGSLSVSIDMHYYPSPFDHNRDEFSMALGSGSCKAVSIYEANVSNHLGDRTTYYVHYQDGDILIPVINDKVRRPMLSEPEAMAIIGRILQIITNESDN